MPCRSAVNPIDTLATGARQLAAIATWTRAKLRLICVTFYAMLQCDKLVAALK